MDVSGSLTLIHFGGILRLIDFGKFLRRRVDIGRNLRLTNLSGFLRFWFRVRVVYYRAFLLITGGSKQKLKVILIDNHFI